MAYVRGQSATKAFIAQLPEKLRDRVLRGAARAAAKIVAAEAQERSISREVAAAVKVKTERDGDRIIAKVQVKGPGAFIAPWLEYGTDPHFISIDDSQRGGRSVRKVNELARAGSLVIGGQFVGQTVLHPGARPHPFLRPALDTKEAEAVAAAQGYINARVGPSGISGSDEGDEA